MKTRKIIGIVTMIGIVFSGSLPSAQHLMDDNVWFKMKMTVKGHSGILEGEDLLIEPYSNVSTVYVRFSPASNAFQHTWELCTLNPTTSEWENYDSGTEYINGGRDGIVIEWSPSWNAGYDTFDAIINGFMKIKRDGLVNKSATFTSSGCLLDGHWVASIYVGCKVTGSAIKPDKLPFPYP